MTVCHSSFQGQPKFRNLIPQQRFRHLEQPLAVLLAGDDSFQLHGTLASCDNVLRVTLRNLRSLFAALLNVRATLVRGLDHRQSRSTSLAARPRAAYLPSRALASFVAVLKARWTTRTAAR